MRVLIACEFSGIVREAFRKRGHDAWSCDLLPTEIPGNHIQGDVLNILNDGWNLMIAHPPCTYLANSGVQYLALNSYRYEQMSKAGRFFMKLLWADIPKICVENPLPHGYANLPKYTQIINPFQFGNDERKKTCLWLRGLPPLLPTVNCLPPAPKGKITRRSGSKIGKTYNYYFHQGKTAHERSRTFTGIANAMAEQWG